MGFNSGFKGLKSPNQISSGNRADTRGQTAGHDKNATMRPCLQVGTVAKLLSFNV